MRTAARLARPVTALGWGAFKIGRNEGAKYPESYALPSEDESVQFTHDVIDMGVRVIDTAPAYGLSEERIGRALLELPPSVREEIFLSTKAGETFAQSKSSFDFSYEAITRSVMASLARLRTNRIDLVWVHSDGSDLEILRAGTVLRALDDLKRGGLVAAIGFSPKSIAGAHAATTHECIDALMIELHPSAHAEADGQSALLERAGELGVGVFVKKPLASGRLDPRGALPTILAHPQVTCVVVGGLSRSRMIENVSIVRACAAS